MGCISLVLCDFKSLRFLHLTFPRVKSWRYDQAKNWAKNLGKSLDEISRRFRSSCAVQNDHQNFSPNSSQFITPCLLAAPVAEISKFHLRELLGLGAPNDLKSLRFRFAIWASKRGDAPSSRTSFQVLLNTSRALSSKTRGIEANCTSKLILAKSLSRDFCVIPFLSLILCLVGLISWSYQRDWFVCVCGVALSVCGGRREPRDRIGLKDIAAQK